MPSFTATLRSETLVVLLHRTALATLLTLVPIVAAACSRPEVPPTAERPTAVTANHSRATSTPSSSPLVPRGMLAEVYPGLRSLAAASSFTITEEWAGLATVRMGAGTVMGNEQYALTRTQTNFAGVGVGWVSLNRMGPTYDSAGRRYELPVQVPTDAAERFLRDLTTVPVSDGPNRPITVVDGFSHVEFAISSDAGVVRIFRDSRRGALWAVEYGTQKMVIDSAAPRQAYELIRPYFDEFKKVGRDKFEEMDVAPVPSPSPEAR